MFNQILNIQQEIKLDDRLEAQRENKVILSYKHTEIKQRIVWS